MKMTILSIATLIVLALGNSAFAQKTIIWKGGTPGQENNWNCSKNWSTNALPNEFSDVIIPDVSSTTQANPVIASCSVELNSLMLAPNASLTIERNAQVVILEHAEGMDSSKLQVKGLLILPDSGDMADKQMLAGKN